MASQVPVLLTLTALLGMAAQWLAWRFRIPAIVLLTLFGLAAGPGLGWIRPDRELGELLHPLVQVGVAIILLEGGLSLRFHDLREAATGVWRLISVGVALSLLFGTAAAHYVGGLSWPPALVFGAITVVTGPTVIVPLLRQARLKKRPASFLKWEGIVNDPTGALLALLFFEYFVHSGEVAVPDMLLRSVLGIAFATALGVGVGWSLGRSYRRGYVPEFLKGPIAFAAALGVYLLANLVLHEAGLAAVTALGVTLANLGLPSIVELRRFKENITILLVSGVFLLLTANLDPHILGALDWRSAALIGALLFLVRPASILLATVGAGMSREERLLSAWIAPRGVVAAAVAGVFGPQLAAAGYAGGELLLPLVFLLILSTVTLHGFSIGWVARRLGLSAASHNGVMIVGASPWSLALAETLAAAKVPVLLADSSWHRLRRARLAGIPVFFGELLSEPAEQTLEFDELGTLFAATDNDAYNSLVCARFAPELGRTRVFQLPPPEGAEARESTQVAGSLRGLIAPGPNAVYDTLVGNRYRGWDFQRTRLTDAYNLDDWHASAPQGALPVAVVAKGGEVRFSSQESNIAPVVGDTLIWYGAREGAQAPQPSPPAARPTT